MSSFALDAARISGGDGGIRDARGRVGGVAAAFQVCAHVWGSERALQQGRLASTSRSTTGNLSRDDALTLVMTSDMNVLRQLKVVNGSYVCVSVVDGGEATTTTKSHIAKLVLVSADEAYTSSAAAATPAEEEEKEQRALGDVTLSPLLAFNLGISLHAAKSQRATAMVRFLCEWTGEHGLGCSFLRIS